MNLPTSPDEEEADKFVAAAASVEAQMESIKVENESYWAEVASVTRTKIEEHLIMSVRKDCHCSSSSCRDFFFVSVCAGSTL